MAQFMLPANSKIKPGKNHGGAPANAKNIKEFAIYRYEPGSGENPHIDRYSIDVHKEDGFFHLHAPKREGGLTRGLYFYRFPYLMLNLYDWGSSIATVEPGATWPLRRVSL